MLVKTGQQMYRLNGKHNALAHVQQQVACETWANPVLSVQGLVRVGSGVDAAASSAVDALLAFVPENVGTLLLLLSSNCHAKVS